ncbi:MAG: SWIM zinc finger domain-containing protein [Hyphomicrobiaceae bacterium]
MEVTSRFAGQSGVTHEGGASAVSFSPDLLREPAYFVGSVTNHVNFREAISTLHHVVVSDLRFKPRDRTEYFAWLEGQKDQILAEAAAAGRDASDKVKVLREELRSLDDRASSLMSPFYKAQRRYFEWLYKVNRDAWFVLDPVIAVHPDEVSFECFSTDESTYGRLSCDLEMFDDIGDFQNGVTNVDYSWDLYNAFQQIRSYRKTELRIEQAGFTASTETGQEIFEQKIDLPDTWLRGFLQVSSAMTMPAQRITFHPMDIHNLCFHLRRRKERHGPRSIRIALKPGEPVEMLFEPWGDRLVCPRAVHHGAGEHEVRLWGRRRLLILERLVPLARAFDFYLLGSGLPSFVVADLGPMKFTLGLSGWTANDWSRAGQFDLLAPRRRTSAAVRERVYEALARRWLGSVDEIARDVQLESADTASALTMLAQNGRVMFDVDKQVWRYRPLTGEPLPFDQLRFQSDEERKADELINAGLVEIRHRDARRASGIVKEDGRQFAVSTTVDNDERLVGATCQCNFFKQNRLRRGPCQHILALRRRAASGGIANVLKGPWGGDR